MAIRPYLRKITAMPATSALVNGDIWVAISPSADFRAARDLALETGRDVETRDDRMVYPDDSAMGRPHIDAALPDAYTRAQNREFTRFKTGR